MKHELQTGFTLLELMIVVGIIGILAAVALPAYQDFTKRAKMSEVVLAASACRTVIAEVYQEAASAPGAGNWRCETDPAGTASRYVKKIATDVDGKITVTVNTGIDATLADGKDVTLRPFYDDLTPMTVAAHLGKAIFTWRCGNAANDGTTVHPKLLPGSCRGL